MDCFEIKNNSSLVRVFHAAPQAPNVDVYVNDQMVFSNLAFGDFTRYVYADTSGTGRCRPHAPGH